MGLKALATTPTGSGVTPSKVAQDVTLYGGVIVSIFTVLANVPALHSFFAATGGVQAVVDALIAVVTAFFSIRAQTGQAQAVATAVANGAPAKAAVKTK